MNGAPRGLNKVLCKRFIPKVLKLSVLSARRPRPRLRTLRSSKSRVYLLKDRDQVGLPACRSVRFPKWTDLIGQTGSDTIYSIPDPTLSLSVVGDRHVSRYLPRGIVIII